MTNREIKRRIGSVKETVKIYRAMYSISVVKMMRTRAALPAADRFFLSSREVMSRVFDPSSDYFRERGQKTAFIVIGGDKGLCGDYNDRLVHYAISVLKKSEERFLFTVGNVTREMLSKSGFEADVEFLHSADNPSPESAYSMAADLINLFEEGMLDEIRLVYSVVTGNHTHPVEERVLPFTERGETLYDGATERALARALYAYLASALYRALIHASLAEHLERVKAMPQATENAEKMIADLTAKYNKVRQEGITRALQDAGIPTDN